MALIWAIRRKQRKVFILLAICSIAAPSSLIDLLNAHNGKTVGGNYDISRILKPGSAIAFRDDRFSFLNYLLNPCGIVSVYTDEKGQKVRLSPGMKTPLNPDGTVDLSEVAQSAKLALLLTNELQNSIGLPECEGLTLETLPKLPVLHHMKNKENLEEAFRSLMFHGAHLYFISVEYESSPSCQNETKSAEAFRRLAGNLQYVQCTIHQLLATSDDQHLKEQQNQNLCSSLHDVKYNRFPHYNECSARVTRDCLVLDRTSKLLTKVVERVEEVMADKAFRFELGSRFKRSKTVGNEVGLFKGSGDWTHRAV